MLELKEKEIRNLNRCSNTGTVLIKSLECNKYEDFGENFKKCSKCKKVYYCSRYIYF